jgi:N-methylhydantoinase A
VTDAYAVLGWLGGEDRLGGTVELDVEAARKVVARLGSELGLSGPECAAGIVRVVEANMAKALRVVSVERGRDPRRFTLLPFGGAGPLHQGALSRELGCRTVIVPPQAGVLSAEGLLSAPIATDRVRTRLRPAEETTDRDLHEGWGELRDEAVALLQSQGAPAERIVRSADCRYRGQAFELEVVAENEDVAGLVERFHGAHLERYGYVQRGEPVEIVNLRVRAEGPVPEPSARTVDAGRGAANARSGERRILVGGEDETATVYDRSALGRGDAFEGPAFVVGIDSTCLILSGQHAEVDQAGNLVVR